MILLVLVSLAFAEPPEPPEPAEPTEPIEVSAPSPAELLTSARVRMLRGDYEGVRILTERLLSDPEADHRAVRYLAAMSWEYDGAPEVALVEYDALLAEAPDDVDVRFRRAEALGRLGRHDEALAELDALGDDWEGGNRVQIEVLRATFELETRKSARKPLKALRDVLAVAGPDEAPWYQAMARHTLVDLAVSEAEAITFTGSKRKKRKRLEQRAELVAIASEQTLSVIHLEAPEYVLKSLLALGRAHEGFGAAMLEESPVKRLTGDQRAIYEAERASHVETLWIKAARYYERGLEYAAAIGWTGEPVGTLHAARAEVLDRVEQFAPR